MSATNTLAADLFSDNFEDPILTLNNWSVVGNGGWNIDSGTYRIILSPGLSNSLPSNDIWDYGWTNIRYELDVVGNSGVDKNILIKFVNSTNFLEFHSNDQGMILEKGSTLTGSQVLDQKLEFLDNNINYHFKIDVKNNNEIKVYINDVLKLQGTETNPLTNWRIGLRAGSGGFGSVDVRFDNIVVNQLPEESPLPTSTATPSATPIALNVPSLKQYSQPWKNKIYAFTKKTIQEFGCALTSSSMVLQYYGHNITPDELNTWLKNQPDGYIRNGLINWLAVSRYTKLHDTTNSPSLEYKRLAGTNENLINELNNNRPSILKVPGHFVVAKSILPTTFGINDPGYSNRDDLSHYGNSFLAINSYIPSHTDLSYIMFVVNPLYNINLFDSNNNVVPSEVYIEEPINNLLNPSQKSGEGLKILIYPKPEKENYVLKVSGPKGKYLLDSYLYDSDGKVTKDNFEGKLNGNDTDKFTINFKGRKRINEKERKSYFRFWFKDKFDFFKYFNKH